MLPNVIFSDPFDPQKRNATRDFMQQVLRGISGAAEVTLFSYKFEDYALATSLAHASRAGARVRMLAHDSLEFRDENEIASQLQCFAELEAAGVEIIRTFSPPNYACAQHVKLLMVADDRGVQVISPRKTLLIILRNISVSSCTSSILPPTNTALIAGYIASILPPEADLKSHAGFPGLPSTEPFQLDVHADGRRIASGQLVVGNQTQKQVVDFDASMD